MSTLEIISAKSAQLPHELQEEVADFADYLLKKMEHGSALDRVWSAASMAAAIRGFEDDPVTYSQSDVTNGL